jgi:hypothetical protein
VACPIGCAGGIDVTITEATILKKLRRFGWIFSDLKSLNGGRHSGMDIHKRLGNITKL